MGNWQRLSTAVGAGALILSFLVPATGVSAAVGHAHLALPVPPLLYHFQNIASTADPTFTQLLGVNDQTLIAGYDGSGADAQHPNKGFTLTLLPTTFTDENFPASSQTQVIGIDNAGDTGGFYVDAATTTHGFLRIGGVYSTVDFPGTAFNQILGLNNNGQAAGYYTDAQNLFHAYTVQNGLFTTPPQIPVNSQATGINDLGTIVGFTESSGNSVSNGFILKGTTLTTLNAPGSTFTQALGVNNDGQVVGAYVDAGNVTHGFLYDNGNFQTIDAPNTTTSTVINGINNSGQIVGFFVDGNNNTIGLVGNPYFYLSAAPNPVDIGQTVTYTAYVRPAPALVARGVRAPAIAAPTGTVTFSDTFNGATTTYGPATLNGSGVATVTTSYTEAQVGTHTIVATYSGDNNGDPAAISNTVLEVVRGCTVYATVVGTGMRLGVLATTTPLANIQYITFRAIGGIVAMNPTILSCSKPNTTSATAVISAPVTSSRIAGIAVGDTIKVSLLQTEVDVLDTTTTKSYQFLAPYGFGTLIHITTP